MEKQNVGTLICFIGIDGSGKTTHASILYKELLRKGISCELVRPRYLLLKFIPLALREWVNRYTYLYPRNIVISSKTQSAYRIGRCLSVFKIPLTLFFLIYVFLTHFLCLRPFLGESIVVCDRYFFDWCYNVWGDIAVVLIRLLPKPDLVFLLDVPVAVAFSRMLSVGDKSISPEYYKSLRDWYLVLAKQEGFFVIDSSGDFKKIKDLILDHIAISLKIDG